MTTAEKTLPKIHDNNVYGFSSIDGLPADDFWHYVAIVGRYLKRTGARDNVVTPWEREQSVAIQPPLPPQEVGGLALELCRAGLGEISMHLYNQDTDSCILETVQADPQYDLQPGYVDQTYRGPWSGDEGSAW